MAGSSRGARTASARAPQATAVRTRPLEEAVQGLQWRIPLRIQTPKPAMQGLQTHSLTRQDNLRSDNLPSTLPTARLNRRTGTGPRWRAQVN